MKLILQQVKSASVFLEDLWEKREIWKWMLVYVCFEWVDKEDYLAKIWKSLKLLQKMKMFSLWSDKIDLSLADISWELLVISNFSIAGRMQKWQRVDFSRSAAFEDAKTMYEDFLIALKDAGLRFQMWEFGAKMTISSEVYGPLNYFLEI